MSQIIGMNPTGQLDYSGTFQMNGASKVRLTPEQIAKENLIKKQNGEFICTEKFKNRNQSFSFVSYALWTLFLILIIYLIYMILSKKKY